jgi:ATP-dependent Clp protease, protease subunit
MVETNFFTRWGLTVNLQTLLLNGKPKNLAPPKNEIDDSSATIYVYDVIDAFYGFSAKALNLELDAANGKPVNLRINTPGGDVFETRAMVTALRNYAGEVTCYIDGIAASCGSWLALAGNKTVIAEGAMVMIHNSWSFTFGNKTDLRKTADLLEKIDRTLIDEYVKKTGKREPTIAKMLDEETWFTAEEAKAIGLVDEIDKPTKNKASNLAANWSQSLAAYSNAPKIEVSHDEEEAELIEDQRALNARRLRFAELAA